MRAEIIDKAEGLFLTFGFKSITMDDIAKELSISKKTLYKFFSNKASLVDATTTSIQKTVDDVIRNIATQGYNAIEESFEIKKVFRKKFSKSKTSPMFQLKKYYPKTFEKLVSEEFCTFEDCLTSNLDNGIKEGLFRADIQKELVFKFYYMLVFGIYEKDMFKKLSVTELLEVEIAILEYHIRAIATPKGVKELEKQLLNFKK